MHLCHSYPATVCLCIASVVNPTRPVQSLSAALVERLTLSINQETSGNFVTEHFAAMATSC